MEKNEIWRTVMLEENIYIGIIKTICRENDNIDTAIIKPLMVWSNILNSWIDIDIDVKNISKNFPIKGDVWFSNTSDNILEGQVWKFRLNENKKYKPSLSTMKAGSIENRKFVVVENTASELLEIIDNKFKNIEEIVKSYLKKEGLSSTSYCNSQVLVVFDGNKLIGPLELILDEHKNKLRMILDNSYFSSIPIYNILISMQIVPKNLNGRFFIDPEKDFGNITEYCNWYFELEKLDLIKIAHLQQEKSNLEHEIQKKSKKQTENEVGLLNNQKSDLEYEIDNLQQKIGENQDKITHLRQEKSDLEREIEIQIKSQKKIENEIDLLSNQKSDLEYEIENLQQEISEKQDVINQLHIEVEEEIQSTKLEKENLENEILNIKNRFVEIEKSLQLQRSRMNEMLDEFDDLLNQRLNRFAEKPESMFAEALANDAFLQLIFGKDKRRLELGSFSQVPQNTPTFEIQQGLSFNKIENFLKKYHNRLKQVDLDESLAIWTTAIILSGQIVVFRGNVMRRGLMTFSNHLTYGRCFELPLSPEIISVERLFSVGQSGNASNLGILDTAILHAAIHREALFILVLEGLDRSPSQYFLDTLINWYARGLLNMPGDAFLSNHLEKLWTEHRIWEQHGLADDVLGWPSNLLIVATISGLVDGFPAPTTVQGKIVEVNVESQGNHLDIHPDLIDQIARKPAGEITVTQWLEWRKEAQDQDVSAMSQHIKSHAKKEAFDTVKQETALRIFAALRTLEKSQDDAFKIIEKYFIES